jgi:predicted phosphodiesterase
MTEAILSCVHANLPALETVLDDIAARGIERLVSLGDIVGYGSHPRECLGLLRGVDVSIMGNHEEAILFHGEDFNPKARQSLQETKDALDSPRFRPEDNLDLWHVLRAMQQVVEVGDVMYCHASPRVPTREYVVPSDARNGEKMAGIFDLITRVCFIGHSHIPHVYRSDGWHAPPEHLGGALDLREHPGRKFLVNVGSVGQPRDGRPGASYVTFDGGVVRFHRVPVA